ncbi:SIMPL domain-containing protein [uncultured Xanthomonas sp.]|uniref:SIMPL domain-containing protein n=1 Tax=uncultured Xanthomonas sp. TaxID=152831 RepID=UPI0025E5A0DD|nr:SIMPL domain-containing protein [uncultured Xanthomonas sp.]
MNIRTLVAWAVAAVLALPAVASAQVNSLPSQPHLLVKGEAQREVIPDRFNIKLTLEAVDVAPEVARARVQEDATSVLSAFKQHHALSNSVQASTLSISPERRYENDRQVFKGTKVQRTLSADFSALDDVRQFLAGLKTSQSLQVSAITPAYSKEAEVRAELKRQAVEQTRVSAQELARAYGVALGGLYTVSTVAPNFAYGIQAGTWQGGRSQAGDGFGYSLDAIQVTGNRAAAAPLAESLEAGTLTLSENVYAVFLIAQ